MYKFNPKSARYLVALVVVGFLMAGCNLGEPAPVTPSPTPVLVRPQDLPTSTPLVTPTVIISIPATNTPLPQLLPAEALGPVKIDGTTHRTLEAVTIRVTRGKSVSTVTCSFVLQDTGQTTPLGTPTSTPIDDNTFEDTYTFTPQAAGTYAVNCTGIALTASGQRAVSAAGTPFAVEAKG
jgi:hypothetical protein